MSKAFENEDHRGTANEDEGAKEKSRATLREDQGAKEKSKPTTQEDQGGKKESKAKETGKSHQSEEARQSASPPADVDVEDSSLSRRSRRSVPSMKKVFDARTMRFVDEDSLGLSSKVKNASTPLKASTFKKANVSKIPVPVQSKRKGDSSNLSKRNSSSSKGNPLPEQNTPYDDFEAAEKEAA